jgi:hypothetical protein
VSRFPELLSGSGLQKIQPEIDLLYRKLQHENSAVGPQGDGWSSIVACEPQTALTTSALPGLSIRLSDIAGRI